jgi:F-type H+-transporting ATPase subunit epsilon
MKTFHLTVAKLGESLFDGEVVSASLPGIEGAFQVLPSHEAFVSELSRGEVRAVDSFGVTHNFKVVQGVAEISHNQATVLL